MRSKNIVNLILLAGLVGCSTKHAPVVNVAGRYVASIQSKLEDKEKFQKHIQKQLQGMFHAYILGQSYLNEFDAQLDKDAAKAMSSAAYHKLLSVRTQVDEFEDAFIKIYIESVLVTALPQYPAEQKAVAQEGLNELGKFLAGESVGSIPTELRPLVLSNIIEKMTEAYDQLKAHHDDPAFGDEAAKKVIYDNMALVRATRRYTFSRELEKYQVDPAVLNSTLATEKKSSEFKKLEKEIRSLSKKMKDYVSLLGRDTSADAISPSAGPNGNVTGRSWPTNTWSITFDDGPAKTTPQVLQNLQNKNQKATFFMLAKQVEGYPNTATSLKTAGMDLASHSYTHAQLTKVSGAKLELEVGGSKATIEKRLGVPVKLFRLPYGAGVSNSTIRSVIAKHQMVHVFWTVDTLDWQDKNPNSIHARTLKQMAASPKNAGVVLYHDIHPQSVAASALLMDYLNARGLKSCTVQGVVDVLNSKKTDCAQ